MNQITLRHLHQIGCFLFFMIFFLVACNDTSPTEEVANLPEAEETVVELTETPEPIEIVSPLSPVATPTLEQSNSLDSSDIPAPTAGLATIYGRTSAPSPEARVWALNGNFIYLAKLIYAKDSAGTPTVPVVSLDPENDIRVDLVAESGFIFSNVEPGEYAFVLASPLDNYVIPGDHPSGFTIIELAADSIVDAGTLQLP